MNSRERCIAAIKGNPVDRIPVFPLLMFFAQSRLGITYREFATNGKAMAEAQLNVLKTFPVDAITACSDAFRVAADLGADMAFPDDKPPFAQTPLVQSATDLSKLGRPDPNSSGSRMADRVLGVKTMAEAVGGECLVLGWVDMPFAEACSLCGVSEFMMLLMEDPPLAHRILDFLTGIVSDFSLAQLCAGAPMIGAGDAAASLISSEQYREFALPYEKKVIKAVNDAGGLVKLHICGNTTHLVQDMIHSGANLFNVDHLVPFESACDIYGSNNICFKGNLDPVEDLMRGTPETCLSKCLDRLQAAAGLRYMLSPGCEVPAETPDAVFQAFCNATKIFSPHAL